MDTRPQGELYAMYEIADQQKAGKQGRDDTCGIVAWFVVDVFWKQLASASRPLCPSRRQIRKLFMWVL